MTTSSSLAVVVICLSISATSLPILNNGDCGHFLYDDRNTNGTTSCDGDAQRFLVRSFSCNGGSAVHICCKEPLRGEVQASRNRMFRIVNWIDAKISANCMKRVWCKEACMDTLYKQPRADYPEDWINDNPDNQELVQAFMHGEAISYCDPNFVPPGNIVFRQLMARMNPYAEEKCKMECQKMYPECAKDMEKSIPAYILFRLSSLLNNLGMFSFDAFMKARDVFDWLLSSTA